MRTAPILFPETLPGPDSINLKSVQRSQSPSSGGAAVSRTRSTEPIYRFDLSYTFSFAEKEVFDAFYKTQTVNGMRWMLFSLPLEGGFRIRLCKLLSAPKYSYIAAVGYTVTLQLETVEGSASLTPDWLSNSSSYTQQLEGAVDTTSPSITVSSAAGTINENASTTITFTLSEAATNFVLADVTTTGGVTLSNFGGSGTTYTATATGTSNFTVSVSASKFTDAAGNQNNASNTLSVTVTPAVVDPVDVIIEQAREVLAVWRAGTGSNPTVDPAYSAGGAYWTHYSSWVQVNFLTVAVASAFNQRYQGTSSILTYSGSAYIGGNPYACYAGDVGNAILIDSAWLDTH